jgi:cytoskeletal protein CcmA (bactofilin family)
MTYLCAIVTMADGTRTNQRPQIQTNPRSGSDRACRAGMKEGRMLQSSEYTYGGKSGSPASNPNSLNPVKTVSAPIEQATIGRTLVIKGEISGAEALYIDGRIEGKISLPDNRVTIGRNGSVQANITAREVVVMGKVNGNIDCSDRVDIRSEGSVTGDVSTIRISVEDGAVLKGGIQVKSGDHKHQNQAQSKAEVAKAAVAEAPKALAATANA